MEKLSFLKSKEKFKSQDGLKSFRILRNNYGAPFPVAKRVNEKLPSW